MLTLVWHTEGGDCGRDAQSIAEAFQSQFSLSRLRMDAEEDEIEGAMQAVVHPDRHRRRSNAGAGVGAASDDHDHNKQGFSATTSSFLRGHL